MIKVAVLGYGTVGSGVVEVIESSGSQVCRGAGEVTLISDCRSQKLWLRQSAQISGYLSVSSFTMARAAGTCASPFLITELTASATFSISCSFSPLERVPEEGGGQR